MEQKKINIKQLKVQSFVTNPQKVKGGTGGTCGTGCGVTQKPSMCTNFWVDCLDMCV